MHRKNTTRFTGLPALLFAGLLAGFVPISFGCAHDDGPVETLGEELEEAGDEIEDELD
ncbi:MAG: hypothetical protein HKP27_13700 [Myxococcales bacterium]|nr:hypothetical protein [Myxococcales bacterium]